MKIIESKRAEFIELTITLKVESHQEFKDLYGLIHGTPSLEKLSRHLSEYSRMNNISI